MIKALASALVLLAFTLTPAIANADAAAEKRRALVLFEEGKQAYQAGRFDESVRLLQEAYGLVQEPVLLYNLARAHEGLGNYPDAIDAYERYLTSAKELPDRGAIEAKVKSLKQAEAEKQRLRNERDLALKQGASKQGAPKTTPEPSAGQPDQSSGVPGSGPSPWPWIVAGAGGAGLVVAGVVGGLALSKNGEAEDAPVQAETVALKADADGLATVSTGLFIAGGAVLAIGTTWGIIDLAASSGEPPQVSLRVGPASGRLVVRF